MEIKEDSNLDTVISMDDTKPEQKEVTNTKQILKPNNIATKIETQLLESLGIKNAVNPLICLTQIGFKILSVFMYHNKLHIWRINFKQYDPIYIYNFIKCL